MPAMDLWSLIFPVLWKEEHVRASSYCRMNVVFISSASIRSKIEAI